MLYMKKIIVLLLCLLPTLLPAQNDMRYRYWVQFADKQGTPYTVNNPSVYLSQRALDRRARLGIAIDSLDLPVNPTYVQAVAATGGTVWSVSKWLNGVVLYIVDSTGVEDMLRAMSFVDDVQFYGRGSIQRANVWEWSYGDNPSAAEFDTLFGPEYYGRGYPNINMLNGSVLHRAGYDGEGVLVGVCDGGFPGVDTMQYFEVLRNEGRLVATRDFVYGGTQVFDVFSHGTEVLSTMATYLPGIYVGTAPKASYVLCRTEDAEYETPLEEFFWAAAVEFMDSLGVDVVNASVGYTTFDDPSWDHPAVAFDGRTTPISRAAETASNRGILVVLAAGNDGRNPGPNIGVPADSPSALTVGAVNSNGVRSVFSSYGPTADGRIKPDVMALGDDVWLINRFGKMQMDDGTSFASPIMAGMAACLMQRYPTLGPAAWCDSIRSWGSLAGNPDNMKGYGIPDFGRVSFNVGIHNLQVTNTELLIYPNPANERLTVSGLTDNATLQVLDVYGRVVGTPSLTDGVVNVSALKPGVYLLRAMDTGATVTIKFIKR